MRPISEIYRGTTLNCHEKRRHSTLGIVISRTRSSRSETDKNTSPSLTSRTVMEPVTAVL